MSASLVQLQGILGTALDANLRGRLSSFIVDETSPAIELFAPQKRQHNHEGDWYGEHAGKWLIAASKAAARSGDAALRQHVLRVADYLVSVQEADGYLGTYATERRFTVKQPPQSPSWDGAPTQRTWDVWVHAYLMLGLIEVARLAGEARYLDAAQRIAALIEQALDSGIDITELGNHFGMSATIVLDPLVELYFATRERRWLELAERVLAQADAHAPLALVTRALAGADAAEIATGKAYQLLWSMVGVAKLHRATGNARYREAAERLWRNVREHHLSLGGGPFGGIAHRSREVFNPAGVFSPQAYVETCSTLAWIELNRELLAISGEAKYAEEIERSACNDLLGAQASNGEDWCYYSFANGRRVHTTYWRCCKSSGAMALEILPSVAYTAAADGALCINLYAPSTAALHSPQAGAVRIEQATAYPFDGAIRVVVSPERAACFALRLRIPSWADGAQIAVNGTAFVGAVAPGSYAEIERDWRPGDAVTLTLPMQPVLHRRVHRNVQESRAPDGSPVRQEVLRREYVAITRGPLVYATDLIDGFKTEETLRLPATPNERWLDEIPDSDAMNQGLTLSLRPEQRVPLQFMPYYRVGARADGAWRLTWMSLVPEAATGAGAMSSSSKNL